MNFLVIDGYVDEPTCLGVPPYLSTYVRYCAGAAYAAGLDIVNIHYTTIEILRQADFFLEGGIDFAVIITGNPVPGKYLGGVPITGIEIDRIAMKNSGTFFFTGGPFNPSGIKSNNSNMVNIKFDIEASIYEKIKSGIMADRKLTRAELEKFALSGAFIVREHPRFPDIIVEMETARGCPREKHCSFCIEGFSEVSFREPEDIINEAEALYKAGIRHYRLGKQADLFSFGTKMDSWKNGFPPPDQESIKKLYYGIRERLPGIKTLHLDNVNPGLIANYPEESYIIAGIIADCNTPGDVAALGMESADPAVIEMNCLKAGPDDVRLAVQVINSAGGRRVDGIPKLLPGINIIRGLPGESRGTFPMNYEFLKSLSGEGLLLRRINIRQLKLPSGILTRETYHVKPREEKKLDAIFRNYREKIRLEIDSPMIEKIFPVGTVLKNLIVESVRGDWIIARQLGTYPVAVNIPRILPLHSKLDAFIIGYRERSITGLQDPMDHRTASLAEIKQIPGLSKRAGEIFSKPGGWDKEDLSISPIYDKIKGLIK